MPVPQTFINQTHYDLNGIVMSRTLVQGAGRNRRPCRSVPKAYTRFGFTRQWFYSNKRTIVSAFRNASWPPGGPTPFKEPLVCAFAFFPRSSSQPRNPLQAEAFCAPSKWTSTSPLGGVWWNGPYPRRAAAPRPTAHGRSGSGPRPSDIILKRWRSRNAKPLPGGGMFCFFIVWTLLRGRPRVGPQHRSAVPVATDQPRSARNDLDSALAFFGVTHQ